MILGCDFSSAPTPRKNIVLALGSLGGDCAVLHNVLRFDTLTGFSDWLQQDLRWVGAFDLPFGLPRELVQTLDWPDKWHACMAHYTGLSRVQVRDAFAAFCQSRPAGGKFAHRATDRPAGASPSMKWVNPPVAFMLHAGMPLLLRAGLELPGLYPANDANRDADGLPKRVALEAYPGMLARELLGKRSYKSDDRARQTPARLIARKDLITALEQGRSRLGVRLKLSHAQRDAMVDDASGDTLDAVLCMLQAAWAKARRDAGDTGYGLPPDMDPLEGWIVSA